ncbi:hypothetical protein J6590_072196 [Homalodisca vitripennis]|nr:hypothetical protein J6590_072196 [Homalodisca vitripennis]
MDLTWTSEYIQIGIRTQESRPETWHIVLGPRKNPIDSKDSLFVYPYLMRYIPSGPYILRCISLLAEL